MKVLDTIRIRNYRAIKEAELKGLTDLNIIIGPNNSGKTTIFLAILKLLGIRIEKGYQFYCEDCNKIKKEWNENAEQNRLNPVTGISVELRKEELFNRNEQTDLFYRFNMLHKLDDQNLVAKRHIQDVKDWLKNRNPDLGLRHHFEKEELNSKLNTLNLIYNKRDNVDGELISNHICNYNGHGAIDHIKSSLNITFCPDSRLGSYKDKSLKEYLRSKDLDGVQWQNLIEFLKEIADPRIHSYKSASFDLIKDAGFITSLDEQGSGIKSAACLASDIISSEEGSIVLIDEPELGLNPAGKKSLLALLAKESKHKQVFIVTHDPTFVNPLLFEKDTQTTLFLYSQVDSIFVKIDSQHNKENPDNFAGYLPHTTSLKEIHIYVEGWTDVGIFREFLEKYFIKKYPDRYYELVNKIGIYHLKGDYWQHLLYTVPKMPYKTLIILDGDKSGLVKETLEKYNNQKMAGMTFISYRNKSSIRFVDDDVKAGRCSLYCLTQSKIEDYLSPTLNNKLDGPKIARNMETLPEEIEALFDAFFSVIFTEKQETKLSDKNG